MDTIENIFNKTKKGEKYYIVEITKKLSHEQFNKGVEPSVEVCCYNFEGMQSLFDYQKELGKDRMYDYRVYEKKKEHELFISELGTMNKMELVAWLS